MSDLAVQAVYAFLVKKGYKKAAKALKKQANLTETECSIDIEELIKNSTPKEEKEHKSSSTSSSSSEEEEEKKMEEENDHEEEKQESKEEEEKQESKEEEEVEEEEKEQKTKAVEKKAWKEKKPKKASKDNSWKGGKFGEYSFNGEKIDRMNKERRAAASYGDVERIPNAARTLHETKGKGFQRSKTKLKRIDYKGKIDTDAVRSFKFDD